MKFLTFMALIQYIACLGSFYVVCCSLSDHSYFKAFIFIFNCLICAYLTCYFWRSRNES